MQDIDMVNQNVNQNKMKAKLIKVDDIYRLLKEDDFHEFKLIIGTTDEEYQKAFSDNCYPLSLKNCQAIECGYDLDKLAREEILYNDQKREWWKAGFQKAIELMDKKFSKEDMRNAFVSGSNVFIEEGTDDAFGSEFQKEEDDFIQSLQQTEWDVDIEMICPHPEDTYVCGIQYGCDEDGCNHLNKIPLLDADGYLILKLKSE